MYVGKWESATGCPGAIALVDKSDKSRRLGHDVVFVVHNRPPFAYPQLVSQCCLIARVESNQRSVLTPAIQCVTTAVACCRLRLRFVYDHFAHKD